jgi:hypothetical protein
VPSGAHAGEDLFAPALGAREPLAEGGAEVSAEVADARLLGRGGDERGHPVPLGLKQETEPTWRARYFDIDLGTIEILPINDAFCSDTVIRTVNAMQAARGLRELSNVSA